MTQNNQLSVTKIRIGIVLLIVWWLPVYLTVPSLTRALGDSGNHHDVLVITVVIIGIQTVIGFFGLFLVGKELATTLRKVSFRKLPAVVWRIVWSGKTEIHGNEFKKSKHAKEEVIVSTSK
jgi:hypothetical protein